MFQWKQTYVPAKAINQKTKCMFVQTKQRPKNISWNHRHILHLYPHKSETMFKFNQFNSMQALVCMQSNVSTRRVWQEPDLLH